MRPSFAKTFSLVVFSVALFASLDIAEAKAARLFIDVTKSEIAVGDQFEIGLFLDTQSATINAVSAAIVFPGEYVELEEIRDGLSIVSFWVEKPSALTPCVDACRVILSGIMPGGYQGPGGLVLALVFRAVQEGEGSIEIQDAETLLHDGEGTSAELTLGPWRFRIASAVSGLETPLPSVPDAEPPEPFAISIAQDANVFDGVWFAVFYAQDKQSGIDYYKAFESQDSYELEDLGNKSLPWVLAEMPYRLQDQLRHSYLYVKAVDRAGNERVAIAPPQAFKGESGPSYYLVLAIGIAAALLAYMAVKKIKKNAVAKRSV